MKIRARIWVALANPPEMKARKRHKTDKKDAWWLAHLLRHAIGNGEFQATVRNANCET
jgi:hypothetical protein